MKESKFKEMVEQFLKSKGCWYVKYWGGGAYTKAGIPDLLVCCNGYFLGVELKAKNGHPTPLQLWNIEQIRKAGGFAIVLYPDQFNDFKYMIEDLLIGRTVFANRRQYEFYRRETTK